MGCSSGKVIKILDETPDKKTISKHINEEINLSENNFHEDIVEKFISKSVVSKYFQYISHNFEQSYVNWEFSGLFSIIRDDLKNIFKRFKIELKIPEDNFTISIREKNFKLECKPACKNDLDFYIPLFFSEFILYPTSLIQKSKIKRIVFVNSILFSDNENIDQYRAAVPDYIHTDSIYVSTKERNVTYIKNIIHHEFFHCIDSINNNYFEDDQWMLLNRKGFVYEKNNFFDNADLTGFISPCSLSGME